MVRFEDTDEQVRRNTSGISHQEIGILIEVDAGENIRQAGGMVAQGALAVGKGTPIGPGELGVLASLGYTRIKVISRPVIAIIATGEELVDPGKPLSGPKIL